MTCQTCQAVFSEEECVVEQGLSASGAAAPADRVSFSIMGVDAKGAELAMTMRLGLPHAYPSHLPPAVEAITGLGSGTVGEAAHAFVEASLHLLYYEGSDSILAGEPCILGWVEWFRDEAAAAILANTK